jgi:hypothetical protein
LKFNQSFEKFERGGRAMQRNLAPDKGSGEAPLVVRLGGKLVLEVLPAALASVIGAFLFAQYQFERGASGQVTTPAVAVPASAEMLQLVREEHAMVHDLLTAQRTAEQNRAVAANVADNPAADLLDAADSGLTAATSRRAELPDGPRTGSRHARTVVAAAGGRESAAAALPPIVIAGARTSPAAPAIVASTQPAATALVVAPTSVSARSQPNPGLWPPQPPPAHPSIVAETLAVPGHVVSATLHAVMAIGGIPSWIGHRLNDDDTGAVAQRAS